MHAEYGRLPTVFVSVNGQRVVMDRGYSLAVTQRCLTAVIGRKMVLMYLQQCVRQLYHMTAQDSHANVGLVREVSIPYDSVYESKVEDCSTISYPRKFLLYSGF